MAVSRITAWARLGGRSQTTAMLTLTRTATRRGFATASSSPSSSSITKILGSFALAGAAGGAGYYWLLPTVGTHDDVPEQKSYTADGLVVKRGPSKDDVTRILSKEAYTYPVRTVNGIDRYDGAQLASNSPCEDRAIHGKFASPINGDHQWMSWGILDGHAGSQTAVLLQDQLVPFVQHSLSEVVSSSNSTPVSQEAIQQAIADGFVNLDNAIVQNAQVLVQGSEQVQDKVKRLLPAFAGTCALLSVYDPATATLHVACTGDSRAVLGHMASNGKWEAVPLSTDQTGSNEEEAARLSKEHPGEDSIVKGGRVLGIMVSRAFGDTRWKWPIEFQKDMQERFFGPTPLTAKYDIRTPPYLTAQPVVTSTKIEPSRPSFLILASDGLWDNLDNQQAVDLVGKWLEARAGKVFDNNNKLQPTYKALDLGELSKGTLSERFVEERTTVQDDNAAVHLVRNSLGGNHHELVAGRLAFDAPFSRDVRDDVTVQVVFFNTPEVRK
jgi:pyruvate dehydrogenase phosphatase